MSFSILAAVVAALLTTMFLSEDRAQIRLPGESSVKGVMYGPRDDVMTFEGKDTIFNARSEVFYADELKSSDTIVEPRAAFNYPNPFSPSLDLHFHLAKTESVTICYYDAKKRLLATAYQGSLLRGYYTFHVTQSYLQRGAYDAKCTIGRRSWIARVVSTR